jgi:hypothetical protein
VSAAAETEVRICAREGCPNELAPDKASGRRRQWCSDRCRKQASYGGVCDTCGGPTRYSGKTRPSPTCAACAQRAVCDAAIRKRDHLIVEAFRWKRLVGRFPTSTDWGRAYRDPALVAASAAFMDAAGPWPYTGTVLRHFGTWAAFMDAVGGSLLSPGRPTTREQHANVQAFRDASASLDGVS